MSAPAALPPFRLIEAALREVTARLVREVVEPQSAAPTWNPLEWDVARAASSIHGLSALLATRLKWRGPEDWTRFLEAQRAQMLARDAQIARQLAQLDAAFAAAGIPCLALKGSALRELQVYDPGERPQGDVDLLVESDCLESCAAPLAALGFEFKYATRRHQVYAPSGATAPRHLGEHAGHPLSVEVHTHIAEDLPVESVDITASLRPARLRAGVNPYASRAALMRHLGLHTAGGLRTHTMRFIQILDIARLAQRMQPADWCELLAADAAGTRPWWLFPPLVMAARHVPGSVPAHVLADLRAQCTPRLAGHYESVPIYEASWSNLRIAALPGIEWSRTAGEALRLARSRIWPSRAALDDIAATLVAQPRHALVRWYGVSHAERIARWMFTRTPRVQTLSVISTALRERGT